MKKKARKKNGELMYAISDTAYFGVFILLFVLGLVPVVFGIAVRNVTLVGAGFVEWVSGFVVLAYLNRDVPMGGLLLPIIDEEVD